MHNTENATVLHGSDKINVIPSKIVVELDGRLLPGYSPDEMISEIKQIVGNEAQFELIRYDPVIFKPDKGLFDILSKILLDADPYAVPVPLLSNVSTDGRIFAKLGIQTYGFLPMKLPMDFNFLQAIHAPDERIPVEAVTFGANAIYKALQRFGEN
jgi:acetylornithine deacetylase/succinyl-diaminopimelate desuccinylase-like protein